MSLSLLFVLLPCTLLLALSLPIGVWALAVLLRSDVRRAFDLDPAERAR